MQLFGDLPLRRKFMIISGVILAGLAVIVSLFMFNLKRSLYHEKQLKTRHLVETAYTVLQYYHSYTESGVMSVDNAQRQAIDMIRSLRYEEKEYFWINDMKPRMIMHPYRPELDGTDLTDYKDPKGKKLFVEFVDTVKKKKAGFVYYLWPKPGFAEPVEKVSYVKGFEPWGWIVGSGIYLDDLDAEFRNQLAGYIVIGIGLLAVVSLSLWLVSRAISRQVTALDDKIGRVASGDLSVSVDIDQKDEIGRLASNFNRMVSDLRTMVANMKSSLRQLSEVEMLSEDIGGRVYKGSAMQREKVSRVFEIFGHIEKRLDVLMRKVGELAGAVESTSSSILEVSASSGEIAGSMETLSGNAARLKDGNVSLGSINKRLDEGAELLGTKVDNLRSLSAEMDSAAKSSLSVVSETSSVAAEMNSLAQESRSSIVDSIEMINRIAGVTRESRQSFEALRQAIERINSILTVIDDITQKTNMLALNAAIIAAQSDESGKAFSVVADEIKVLSQKTQQSTKDITVLIEDITGATDLVFDKIMESERDTDNAVAHFNDVDARLKKIISLVDCVTSGIRNVVTSTKEQSKASNIVRTEVDDLQSVSQSLAGLREEGNAMGGTQASIIADIADVMYKVNMSTREQNEALAQVKQSVIELSEFSSELFDHFRREIEELNSAKPVLDEIGVQAKQNTDATEELRRKFSELSEVVRTFDELSGRFKLPGA